MTKIIADQTGCPWLAPHHISKVLHEHGMQGLISRCDVHFAEPQYMAQRVPYQVEFPSQYRTCNQHLTEVGFVCVGQHEGLEWKLRCGKAGVSVSRRTKDASSCRDNG